LIALGRLTAQAGFGVAQTLPIGQLRGYWPRQVKCLILCSPS
jgi:hypothetical protein